LLRGASSEVRQRCVRGDPGHEPRRLTLGAGIAVVVFFLIQQQENHLLQPLILSRAVKVFPLAALGRVSHVERA